MAFEMHANELGHVITVRNDTFDAQKPDRTRDSNPVLTCVQFVLVEKRQIQIRSKSGNVSVAMVDSVIIENHTKPVKATSQKLMNTGEDSPKEASVLLGNRRKCECARDCAWDCACLGLCVQWDSDRICGINTLRSILQTLSVNNAMTNWNGGIGMMRIVPME